MGKPHDALMELLSTVIAPLVESDGGEVHVVSLGEDEVVLHLTGACSGCPGISITTCAVIEPAVRKLLPGARVRVTTGPRPPVGATRVEAKR
ncbi:MAG: NifU family protein [Deltaproteobacteria bacterium]|nr:NifU family protein [Deltaproteobacteria bacterium]